MAPPSRQKRTKRKRAQNQNEAPEIVDIIAPPPRKREKTVRTIINFYQKKKQ